MRIDAPAYVPLALRQVEADEEERTLLDLDLGCIRHICSRLTNIKDVISFSMTCRLLRDEIESCSDLSLHHGHPSTTSNASISAPKISLMTRNIIKITPLVTSLDLSNLPLESRDLDYLLSHLSHLKRISLEGCKSLNKSSLLFSSDSPLRPPSLTELDLQRCFQLTAGDLKALITSQTPWNLHSLFLSHLFFLPKGIQPHTSTPTLKSLALHNCSQMDAEGLIFITSCCPNLSHLFLGGSTFSSEPLSPQTEPLNTSDPNATLQVYTQPIVGVLHLVVLSLPLLELLELTFTGGDIITSLYKLFWGSALQILDLSSSRGVELAIQCLKQDLVPGLSSLIQCAAKCKSSRKSITPLHLAAHTGDVQMTKGLLSLGALIDARDGSGSTALFVACEQGRADVVSCLMHKGSDLSISNSDGEHPLYIAALRGHLRCVEVLLSFTMNWRQYRFSDGWSPLHAACIGWSDSHHNHLSIARLLLSTSSDQEEIYRMLSATNRYGQTPIHLAARKSAVLLDLFFNKVMAGSGEEGVAFSEARFIQLVTQKDTNRATPLDVAEQNKNTKCIEMLQQIIHSF